MAVIGDIVPFTKGVIVRTTVRVRWRDGPMTRKAAKAIRSQGANKKSMTQREIGQILVAGLDVILEERMRRQRLRQEA